MSSIRRIEDTMPGKVNRDSGDFLVEKSLGVVPDCFRLVVLAACRAQELAMGAPTVLKNRGSHKNGVLALREIASGEVDLNQLEDRIVKSFQQVSFLSHKP